MQFHRKILPTLKENINNKEIIVLTGMRRVGKTTLLKMIFDSIPTDNKIFLDIENPLEQKIFEELDYNNIWANLKTYNISSSEKAYIFLDEIQAMPGIVKPIKYLYDHYNTKFFLTGSSSFYLKNLFSESLAGRKIIFDLYPLDFEEFLIFKQKQKQFFLSLSKIAQNKNLITHEKIKPLYDEYLIYGGFPQVVLQTDIQQKQTALQDIIKSYFQKDVALLADFKDIRIFRDCLLLLAQRVGSKLEIAKIASELSVSRETIYSYLSFLESTYVIYLISPFTLNVDREISGTKKIYLCDTGIINQLARVSEENILENSVFLNLKKYGKINYYQRRVGREVDFILNTKIAIEVKQKTSSQELSSLQTISKSLNFLEHYLITKEYSTIPNTIPASNI